MGAFGGVLPSFRADKFTLGIATPPLGLPLLETLKYHFDPASGEFLDPERDRWPGRRVALSEISDKRETITKNEADIARFKDAIADLTGYAKMELESPGSTSGRADYTWDPKKGFSIHETNESKIVNERLEYYRDLEREQGQPKTRRRKLMQLGQPERKTLAESITEKLAGSKNAETEINRLLNYGKHPLRRQTAEKLDEYATAKRNLDEAMDNRIDPKNYLRRLTEEERLDRVVQGIRKGQNSMSLLDKIMSISKQIEKPKFHVMENPETGERQVILGNAYHVAKPASVISPSEQLSIIKHTQGRADTARLEWSKLEDDRGKSVGELEKELLALETRNDEGIGAEDLSSAEMARMKKLPKLIQAKKDTYAVRFQKLMGDFPAIFGSQQMQTGVME